MEQWFSAIQTAFDFSARKGWMMFLFGALMIVLMKVGLIPAEDTQPGWFTFFVAVAVFGAVILLVHLVAWMIGDHQSKSASRAKLLYRKHQQDALFAEGVRNLDVLDENEKRILVWILRQDKNRFSADVRQSNGTARLVNKQIILRDPRTSAQDVWEINPGVWEKRAQILKEYENIQTPDGRPWDSLSAW